MTGPEHYRLAEQMADRAYHYTYGDGADTQVGIAFAAMAQVHATLALTAATALETAGVPGDGATAQAWRTTICEAKPEPVTT